MIQPGIEPQSPGPLANTLHHKANIYIYIYIYIYMFLIFKPISITLAVEKETDGKIFR